MLPDYAPDAIDVQIAELLVATADDADAALDRRVTDVLRLLREKLGMDVVFVSRFEDGRRTFLNVDHAPGADVIAAGQSDPLEESWCQRVVDGRIPEAIPDARPYIQAGKVPAAPFPIGAHLSAPVPSPDGGAMGTLCCFSFEPKDNVGLNDVKRLKYAAQFLADKLKKAAEPGKELTLHPKGH